MEDPLQIPLWGFGIFDVTTIPIPKRGHVVSLRCVPATVLSEEEAFVPGALLAASRFFCHIAIVGLPRKNTMFTAKHTANQLHKEL